MTRRSFRHVWLIARLTLREAQRRRLLWIAGALGLAFLAMYGLGFNAAYHDILSGDAGELSLFRESIAGGYTIVALYAVNFLIVMMTVLTVVGTISQEVSSSTIQSIAAKPLYRWEIFAGKWLGHALMLAAYGAIMFCGVLGLTALIAEGYVPPRPLEGLGLLLLEGMVILSVTLLGSTLLSTLANGVMVFMLYGLAFLGAWTEQIGAFAGSQTAVDLGILSSMILPTEALWRRAAYLMQTPLTRGLSFTPFSSISVPNGWFVLYAGVYLVMVLAAALWTFVRRDL